jgi:hypothetical protein
MSTSAAKQYHRHGRRRERGAALLILLTLIVVGFSSFLMSAYSRESAEQRQTRATLQALGGARDAVIGFALRNNRLPRPAISATNGRERVEPCRSAQECSGLLPWTELGLEPGDGWGHLLRYSVTPAFAESPVPFDTAVPTKTLRGRHGQDWYDIVGGDGCAARAGAAPPCAPAMISSSGRRNYGVSVQGVEQLVAPGNHADEAVNAAAIDHFISRAASGESAIGGDFDDLVEPVPLPLLLRRVHAVAVQH